jgi:hypothetical protein
LDDPLSGRRIATAVSGCRRRTIGVKLAPLVETVVERHAVGDDRLCTDRRKM